MLYRSGTFDDRELAYAIAAQRILPQAIYSCRRTLLTGRSDRAVMPMRRNLRHSCCNSPASACPGCKTQANGRCEPREYSVKRQGYAAVRQAPLEQLRRARLAAAALVALYRYTLSPLIGLHCRHLPTCSEYRRPGVRALRLLGRRLDDARAALPLPPAGDIRARLRSRRVAARGRAGICPGATAAGAERMPPTRWRPARTWPHPR